MGVAYEDIRIAPRGPLTDELLSATLLDEADAMHDGTQATNSPERTNILISLPLALYSEVNALLHLVPVSASR